MEGSPGMYSTVFASRNNNEMAYNQPINNAPMAHCNAGWVQHDWCCCALLPLSKSALRSRLGRLQLQLSRPERPPRLPTQIASRTIHGSEQWPSLCNCSTCDALIHWLEFSFIWNYALDSIASWKTVVRLECRAPRPLRLTAVAPIDHDQGHLLQQIRYPGG